MISIADREFLHRLNRDGTVDSICPRCIRTVASHYAEALLANAEAQHKCQGPELRFLRYTGRPHQPLFSSHEGRQDGKQSTTL
jgi:hypothetical protein